MVKNMLKLKNYTESIEQISLKYYPNNQCAACDLLTNDLELFWNTICEIYRHGLNLVVICLPQLQIGNQNTIKF